MPFLVWRFATSFAWHDVIRFRILSYGWAEAGHLRVIKLSAIFRVYHLSRGKSLPLLQPFGVDLVLLQVKTAASCRPTPGD